MHFRVTILGSSSAIPAFGRNPSGQFLLHHDRGYLIDCGEATQMRIQQYRQPLRRLDAIFITHLHGDHVLGLIGLLSSMSVNNRLEPLTLIGPVGIKEFIDLNIRLTHSFLRYELHITELSNPDFTQAVFETEHLSVFPLPLQHRIPTVGFLFREKPRRKKFIASKAFADEVPPSHFHLLKQGMDAVLADGRKVLAEDYLAPPDPSLSYAYCSDTAYTESLIPFIQGTNVLYHDATFLAALSDRAEETAHSTAAQAAQIAELAGVETLLLGHFSARYRDLDDHLFEARAIFPETYLALDGYTFFISRPPGQPHAASQNEVTDPAEPEIPENTDQDSI
jgi:ribonuclease Z